MIPVLVGAGRYATPLHVGITFGFVAAAVAAAAFARTRAANRPAVVGVSPVSVHVDVPGALVRRCAPEQIVQIAQTLTRAAAAVGSPAGSSNENGVGDATRSPEPGRREAGTGDGS